MSALAVGDRLPELRVHVTRQRLVRYAGASGDFNPIHYSEYYAAAVGLPGVIAHGMLTMGTALRVVTDWLGERGQVRSYFVRFTKPVVVPDDAIGTEVVFVATVAAVEDRSITFAIEAVCDEVKVLGAAKAEVLLDD